MSTPAPEQHHYTPNVVVDNPLVRKVVGNTLAVASLLLSIAALTASRRAIEADAPKPWIE